MKLATEFMANLPRLRRYARAITGNQDQGDLLVEQVLENLINYQDTASDVAPDIFLFRKLSDFWNCRECTDSTSITNLSDARSLQAVDGRLHRLSTLPRQVFLLIGMEQFSNTEACEIMRLTEEELSKHLEAARSEVKSQIATDVLIIEDELFIATDLENIVCSLGHQVVDIVRTRSDAVAAYSRHRPGLVLSDIQLADGSSGIDAVTEILSNDDVPVIFITAYPERLLTGLRPEPTYLITKPFTTGIVKTVIQQALFFAQGKSVAENHLPTMA